MILAPLVALWMLSADVPVDPDGDQAQQWIIQELAKPEYQAAKPTLWDTLSQEFLHWLSSLDFTGGGTFNGPLLALLVTIVIGAIVAAFFIFGRPQRNRRSAVIGSLFGQDETRDSEGLRKAALAAASDGNWALAIEEMFRAIARNLSERVIVSTEPGTTAREFARRTSEVFPDFANQLAGGADSFDGVRYLDRPGSREEFDDLTTLEKQLRTLKAAPASMVPSGAAG